jgi:hypothetical protein
MQKVNKAFIISACLIVISQCLYSQGRSQIGVHAGYLNPKDTDSGMMFGAMFISSFDEAVDVGFGFDIFQKSYSDQTHVASLVSGDTYVTTQKTLVDYTRTAIPLYLSLKIKIPTVRSRNFGYFIRANLSYQFLISKEKNYEMDISETRKYKGLGWQAGGGLFYRIGSRSTLFGEGILNNCTVSRDVSNPTESLPLTERVNLSGLGLRIGVELDLR